MNFSTNFILCISINKNYVKNAKILVIIALNFIKMNEK